jgi:hypothetical protein
MKRRFAPLALVLALACVAGFASSARADGDPASDVLYFQDVFLPYVKPSADVGAKLTSTVAAANKAGFRIKVAVIQAEQDLGSVPSLFNRQDLYARFLGAELKTFYSQRLLIVMPAGFGIYDGGKSVDQEKSVLAGITIASPSSDDLTNAANEAVEKLRSAIGGGKRKDAVAPTVRALASTGTKGKPAKLRYTVYDASGKAREIVRVYGPAYLLFASIPTKLGKAKPKHSTSVTWKVPADLTEKSLRFCVLAQDATGNQSKTSCAALKIS